MDKLTNTIVKNKPYRVRVGRMEELFITITAARQFARDLVKNHDHRGVAIYCQLITGEWVKYEEVKRDLSIEEKQMLGRRATDRIQANQDSFPNKRMIRTQYGTKRVFN